MRFLVDSSSSLGDLAIDVALFRAIVRNGHELEVLAGEACADALVDCDFIGRVHRKGRAWPGKVGAYWRATRSRQDAIIVPRMFAGRLKPLNLFGRAEHWRDRRHMDRSLYDQGAVIYRLSILDGLIDDWSEPVDTRIFYRSERVREAQKAAEVAAGDAYMTVAPGSAKSGKRWPAANFVRVLQQMRSRFARIVVVGAPNEKDLCERIAKSGAGAGSVAGRIDLAATCALVSNAALHLGNDSGLGHVAAGNEVPTLAIGGQDRHYVPWCQHMLPGAPEQIGTEPVLDRAAELLASSGQKG